MRHETIKKFVLPLQIDSQRFTFSGTFKIGIFEHLRWPSMYDACL